MVDHPRREADQGRLGKTGRPLTISIRVAVSVLVLTAIGTIPREDIEHLGFHVMPRPFVIEDLVREVQKVTATSAG